jgi:hypothetical protein
MASCVCRSRSDRSRKPPRATTTAIRERRSLDRGSGRTPGCPHRSRTAYGRAAMGVSRGRQNSSLAGVVRHLVFGQIEVARVGRVSQRSTSAIVPAHDGRSVAEALSQTRELLMAPHSSARACGRMRLRCVAARRAPPRQRCSRSANASPSTPIRHKRASRTTLETAGERRERSWVDRFSPPKGATGSSPSDRFDVKQAGGQGDRSGTKISLARDSQAGR